MNWRFIPNFISLLRIALVVPIVLFLIWQRYFETLVLFTIAGFSDALDGFLAKRYSWESRLGTILDPVADKILLLAAYITLGVLALIPWWLVIIVFARDIIIFSGAIAYHYLIGKYELVPTYISKTNTFIQIIFILAVLFTNGVFSLPLWLMSSLVYFVLVTTLFSGVDYIWHWGKIALIERRNMTND